MASLLIERSFRRSGNLAPRSSAALAVLKGGRRRGVDDHRRRERALQPPPVPGKKSTPGKFYPCIRTVHPNRTTSHRDVWFECIAY